MMNSEQITSELPGIQTSNVLSRLILTVSVMILVFCLYATLLVLLFYKQQYNSPYFVLFIVFLFVYIFFIIKSYRGYVTVLRSLSILLVGLVLLGISPVGLRVIQSQKQKIHADDVSPTLKTFEDKVKSGLFSSSADAYKECRSLNDKINEESLDSNIPLGNRDCLVSVALHFNDPLVCQEDEDTSINQWVNYNNVDKNGKPYTTYEQIKTGTFIPACIYMYALVKGDSANCDILPDGVSTATTSLWMRGTGAGGSPRGYCKAYSNPEVRYETRFKDF